MSYDFQTTTHGKWILTGEHAVLRGYAALVFPILDKTLNLEYKQHNKNCLQLTVNYAHKDYHINSIVNKIINHAFATVDTPIANYSGTLNINSNIPPGLGMGASAALCVAISRWFTYLELITPSAIYDFAKNLENFFHGQSSGLDIAGSNATAGVYFQQGQYKPIQTSWQPKWQLTSCGETSTTERCINIVKKVYTNNQLFAKKLDEDMHRGTLIAKEALEKYNNNSIKLLVEAINIAKNCFENWGLITPKLQQHMQEQLDKGALAVKPTGSGGGGLAVSLWG